jgi:hypothetical protein
MMTDRVQLWNNLPLLENKHPRAMMIETDAAAKKNWNLQMRLLLHWKILMIHGILNFAREKVCLHRDILPQ